MGAWWFDLPLSPRHTKINQCVDDLEFSERNHGIINSGPSWLCDHSSAEKDERGEWFNKKNKETQIQKLPHPKIWNDQKWFWKLSQKLHDVRKSLSTFQEIGASRKQDNLHQMIE